MGYCMAKNKYLGGKEIREGSPNKVIVSWHLEGE